MNQLTKYQIVSSEVETAFIDVHNHVDDYEIIEAKRQLNFKASDFLKPSDVFKIMRKFCPGYNNFEYKLIKLFPEDCEIQICREGSVCFYVKKNKEDVVLPSQKSLLADEYYTKEGNITRIWWD